MFGKYFEWLAIQFYYVFMWSITNGDHGLMQTKMAAKKKCSTIAVENLIKNYRKTDRLR